MTDFPKDIYTEPEPDADTLANLGPLTGMAGIWTEMFRQKRRHMREDAQVLAVSTAAEDDITRERRLSNYLNIGMSVVGIAAFFVPPVGAALLLVTADQLLFETIEGVRELSQGDNANPIRLASGSRPKLTTRYASFCSTL